MTEYPALCEALYMYWLIVLFQLEVVKDIIIPVLQTRRLEFIHGGSVAPPSHAAGERQG